MVGSSEPRSGNVQDGLRRAAECIKMGSTECLVIREVEQWGRWWTMGSHALFFRPPGNPPDVRLHSVHAMQHHATVRADFEAERDSAFLIEEQVHDSVSEVVSFADHRE